MRVRQREVEEGGNWGKMNMAYLESSEGITVTPKLTFLLSTESMPTTV